jgi:cytochrome b6-f complex iron-sulfur subunit/menaquinol-cytochrome c reductase iron-sulfur subunit
MTATERNETNPEQNAAASAEGSAPAEAPRALRRLVILGGLAYAGALVVPAASFVGASAESAGAAGARWIRVARLADIAEGAPRRVQIIADQRDAFTLTRAELLGSIWILRRGESVRALSAVCPHLGCSIDLAPDLQGFACPCHASRFGLDGAATAGPSPRSLDPLATRLVEGWIEVDFRRYRQGIAERREVSA